jgi:hypothetical protein
VYTLPYCKPGEYATGFGCESMYAPSSGSLRRTGAGCRRTRRRSRTRVSSGTPRAGARGPSAQAGTPHASDAEPARAHGRQALTTCHSTFRTTASTGTLIAARSRRRVGDVGRCSTRKPDQASSTTATGTEPLRAMADRWKRAGRRARDQLAAGCTHASDQKAWWRTGGTIAGPRAFGQLSIQQPRVRAPALASPALPLTTLHSPVSFHVCESSHFSVTIES